MKKLTTEWSDTAKSAWQAIEMMRDDAAGEALQLKDEDGKIHTYTTNKQMRDALGGSVKFVAWRILWLSEIGE